MPTSANPCQAVADPDCSNRQSRLESKKAGQKSKSKKGYPNLVSKKVSVRVRPAAPLSALTKGPEAALFMAKERLTASKQAIKKNWVLYVLRCQDETLYCGITNDLKRRIDQHNCGKGARYTKGRGPVTLLKSWPAISLSAALKAERTFKKLTKQAKLEKLKSRSRKDAVSHRLQGL